MRIKRLFAAMLCMALLLLSACSVEYTSEYQDNEYDIGETAAIYADDGETLCAMFCINSYVLTKEAYVSDKLVDFKDGAPVYERITYPYKIEIKYTFTNINGYDKLLKADNFEINPDALDPPVVLSVDNSSLVIAVKSDAGFELKFKYDSQGEPDAIIYIPVSIAYNTDILEDLNSEAEKLNAQAEEAALGVVRALIIFTVSLLAVGIVGLIIFFSIYSRRQKKKIAAAPPIMPFSPQQPPFSPPQSPFAPMAPASPTFTDAAPQPSSESEIPAEVAPSEPETASQSPDTPDNDSCNDKDFFTN